MALVLKDRVVESSTSTGTGSFTLSGAETGYQSFSATGSGNSTYYTIQGKNSDGTLTGEWEVGSGTYTSGTLTRTTVFESSNSNNLVNFSIGLKDVFIDLPSEKAVYLDSNNLTNSVAGVQFDTTATPTIIAGLLGWDGNNTLSIGMASGNVTQHIGEDQYFYVKASSAITKGQVCMFTGAVGASGVLTAAPATGTTLDGLYIMGIAAETIAHNGFGLIQTFGTLRGINTSAYADGDILWYDPTSTGGFTKTQPNKAYTQVVVAAVANATNNGTLAIRLTYIPEFSELPGISITSPTTGQAIVYNSGTGFWSNSNAVVVNGGSVDNSPIGATTASTGSFTTLIGGSGSANYGQLTGGATTKAVEFKSLGSDTNISMAFQPKGTGAIDLAAGSSGVNISNGGTVTAITRTAQGTLYTSAPTWTASAPTTAGGTTASGTSSIGINSATVVSGGTGYTVGDTLTVVGGTFTTVGQLTVTAVSGGVITAATNAAQNGVYSALPASPASVTGGTGTGATFTVTGGILSNLAISVAGSGYIEQPTVSFSGGGGSGASAYATVGSGTSIRALGSTGSQAIDFYTAASIYALVPALRIRDTVGDSYFQVQNQTSTALLVAQGSSNANAMFCSNGTGFVSLRTNGGSQVEQFRAAHTASAVNYVQVTGGATGAPVAISAQGSDATVGLQFYAKSASIIFTTAGANARSFNILHTTSPVNYLQVQGNTTGVAPILSAQGTDTNIDLALTPKGSGKIAIGAPIKQLVASTASASTITPTADSATQYEVTALAVTATIAAPSGTPTDGQKLVLRIKDNGSAQTLNWTTTSGGYRAVGTTLPTATTAGKVGYYGCIYNSQDTFWDVVAIAQL